MRLGEVLELKAGDVLPIQLPDTVTGKVDGVPVMECQFGTLNDHHALRVLRLIDHGAGHTAVPASILSTVSATEEAPDE
jgi:flagellar motor switch protein FliM